MHGRVSAGGSLRAALLARSPLGVRSALTPAAAIRHNQWERAVYRRGLLNQDGIMHSGRTHLDETQSLPAAARAAVVTVSAAPRLCCSCTSARRWWAASLPRPY